MTGFNIEGADSITEEQLNFIKEVLSKRGFGDAKVTIGPVGKAGDNFASSVKRIVAENDNGDTLKIIAKLALNIANQAQGDSFKIIYTNESIVYEKLFPKFDQLQEHAGIPPEDQLKHPECYGTLITPSNEIILLEDLNERGFGMLDKLVTLNDSQVKSVLRNLAKFHALSYVLKTKEPNLFEELANSFHDLWDTTNETEENKNFRVLFLKQVEQNALMILDNDKHKEIIRNLIPEANNIGNQMKKADKYSKQIVIQQGDAWVNNIMYNLESEPIPESIMIDYQLVKPANPVCDLLYMIFNCTDYKTRKDHYNDWIEFYHNEMEDFLSNFGLKANYIYPKDLLDADLKRYGKLGFVLVTLASSVTLMSSEDAAKLMQAFQSEDMNDVGKSMDLSVLGSETFRNFKIKMQGTIDSLLELGLL